MTQFNRYFYVVRAGEQVVTSAHTLKYERHCHEQGTTAAIAEKTSHPDEKVILEVYEISSKQVPTAVDPQVKVELRATMTVQPTGWRVVED